MAESYFGKELKKYYVGSIKQLVYRNGKTQNELAEHIAEVTGTNFEASILSRAKQRPDGSVKSKQRSRVPNREQVEAIAQGLDMSGAERYELIYAAVKDLCLEKEMRFDIAALSQRSRSSLTV